MIDTKQGYPIPAMEGFEIVFVNPRVIEVKHRASSVVFRFARSPDGALDNNTRPLNKIPREAELHISDARRAAIANLTQQSRREAVIPRA